MSRVVVDDAGGFVGVAYTRTVLQPGHRIVDLTPADIDKLLSGWTVGSLDLVFERLRAFRDDPRMEQVLALGPGEELGGNLLRNWAQDITRFCQHIARDVLIVYRNQADGTNPVMVEPDEEAAG